MRVLMSDPSRHSPARRWSSEATNTESLPNSLLSYMRLVDFRPQAAGPAEVDFREAPLGGTAGRWGLPFGRREQQKQFEPQRLPHTHTQGFVIDSDVAAAHQMQHNRSHDFFLTRSDGCVGLRWRALMSRRCSGGPVGEAPAVDVSRNAICEANHKSVRRWRRRVAAAAPDPRREGNGVPRKSPSRMA